MTRWKGTVPKMTLSQGGTACAASRAFRGLIGLRGSRSPHCLKISALRVARLRPTLHRSPFGATTAARRAL